MKKKRNISFPFITTNPVTDPGLGIGLIPIWWLIGIEQIIWPILFSWVSLNVIYIKKGKIILPRILRVFLLFVIFQFLSAFSLEEPYPFIVFIKNLAVFISPILILFIITNSISTWAQVKYLIKLLVLSLGFSLFIGLLGILIIWRPEFNSPISQILLKFILGSETRSKIILRSIGKLALFNDLQYFRVNNFITFAPLYATTLISVIPLAVFLYSNYRKAKAGLLWMSLAGLMIFILFSTTGRSAILSFTIAFLIFLYLTKRRTTIVILITSLIVGAVLIFFKVGFIETLVQIITMRSTTSRFEAYSLSLFNFFQKPMFGWGIPAC